MNSDKKLASQSGKVSHEENSRTGIALVQAIWPVEDSSKWIESKFPKQVFSAINSVRAVLVPYRNRRPSSPAGATFALLHHDCGELQDPKCVISCGASLAMP